MTQPHGGHILTSKLKKSLEMSMHLGGKDINLGFGGGEGNINLYKIYTPEGLCNENQNTYLIF